MLSQEHPGLSRVPPNVLTGEHGMGFSRQDGARPLRILASPEELTDGLQDVERIVGRVERMSVAKRIPNNSPTLAAWGRVQRRIELTFARARSDRDFITACRMAATRHCVLRKARGSKSSIAAYSAAPHAGSARGRRSGTRPAPSSTRISRRTAPPALKASSQTPTKSASSASTSMPTSASSRRLWRPSTAALPPTAAPTRCSSRRAASSLQIPRALLHTQTPGCQASWWP